MRTAMKDALLSAGIEPFIPAKNLATAASLSDALSQCKKLSLDAIIVAQPTIGDGRLAPIIEGRWGDPPLIWATPERPDTPKISANSLVGSHLFAATLRQQGAKLEFVYGHPESDETKAALLSALRRIVAYQRLTNSRVGLIGSHAPGFIDLHCDPAVLKAKLGTTLLHIGMIEFLDRFHQMEESKIEPFFQEMREMNLPSEINNDLLPIALRAQARYAALFSDIMDKELLDALAFRCWPDLPSMTGHWPYAALAILSSQGRALAMEGDVDGALCKFLAFELGCGHTYISDWLSHDHTSLLAWHTGAAAPQLCAAPGHPTGPRWATQFNNQLPTVINADLRVDMEVTIFRLWSYLGNYHICLLKGRTIQPRQPLPGTNGLISIEDVDVSEWLEEMIHYGMPHHICIVEGDHQKQIKKFARLAGITYR